MHYKQLLRTILLSFLICLPDCSNSTSSEDETDDFTFWTVGSGRVSDRFGTNIYKALDSLKTDTGQFNTFLLTIAEEPQSIDQIIDKSGLSQAQVEYFIAGFEACHFIKRYKEDQWAMTFPAITDRQMLVIRKNLSPMANSVAEYFQKKAPQIRTLYDSVKSPFDPAWEKVSHLILDKFIIDGTFHASFNDLRENDVDAEEPSVMPAFFLQTGENFINFGCNWYKFTEDEEYREIYVLHGGILKRYDIAMNRYRRDKQFAAGLFKLSPEGRLDSLTDLQKEKLKDLEWISGDSLLVPVVDVHTMKSMLPAIEESGMDLAQFAYTRYTDLEDSYNRSSYSEFLDYKEDYIQVLIHSLFGLVIEQLVESGTVSPVPEPVPGYFGVYIVNGELY